MNPKENYRYVLAIDLFGKRKGHELKLDTERGALHDENGRFFIDVDMALNNGIVIAVIKSTPPRFMPPFRAVKHLESATMKWRWSIFSGNEEIFASSWEPESVSEAMVRWTIKRMNISPKDLAEKLVELHLDTPKTYHKPVIARMFEELIENYINDIKT